MGVRWREADIDIAPGWVDFVIADRLQNGDRLAEASGSNDLRQFDDPPVGECIYEALPDEFVRERSRQVCRSMTDYICDTQSLHLCRTHYSASRFRIRTAQDS